MKFKILYNNYLDKLEAQINEFINSDEQKGYVLDGWTFEVNNNSVDARHIVILSFYKEDEVGK